ncbi:hypothetical protein IE4872_PD00990 (plasmid) [Rhizobium gallicum]|uniref:Uncharacterized protein n=1 Tax=Rhizobium gallicum TaxID=56730 RepID=A0A1L5NUI6_9HYPH|nr:hypothetical protein IE4872_PD00990 [Rhizobium gallicum]
MPLSTMLVDRRIYMTTLIFLSFAIFSHEVVVVAMNPIEDVQIIASPAYTLQTVRDALSALY